MSAKFFGFNAPFLSVGPANRNAAPTLVLPRQVDERIIRNDLLQLLLTAPGERVMRPQFGSGIRPFLFEQITQEGVADLQRNIRDTIAQHEQRVNVTDVQIVQNENMISISVLGTFKLDRFQQIAGNAADTDLLVELKIPTNKTSAPLT